jgi:hypothetical protein
MRALVVFESIFGNTEALAEAVADGLRGAGADVELVRAGVDGDHALHGVDLLVLAAPTHTLSMSRPASRAQAVQDGGNAAAATTGVREWLERRDPDTEDGHHPLLAVFDTKARVARHWPGSAAGAAARALRHDSFTVVARTSFYVEGVEGPLLPGELDRARGWGAELALVSLPAPLA